MSSSNLRPVSDGGLALLDALGFTVTKKPAPDLVGGVSLDADPGTDASVFGAASFCRRHGLRVSGRALLQVADMLAAKVPPDAILARLRANSTG